MVDESNEIPGSPDCVSDISVEVADRDTVAVDVVGGGLETNKCF